MEDKDIKRNIRKIRRDMHKTQKEMAEILGISRTAYRNLEDGNTRIFCPHLDVLSSISGKSKEELVLGYKPVEENLARLQEGADWEEKFKTTVDDYEKRLFDKDQIIEALNTAVKSLKDSLSLLQNNC